MRGERIFVSSSAFCVKLVGQRGTIYSDFFTLQETVYDFSSYVSIRKADGA